MNDPLRIGEIERRADFGLLANRYGVIEAAEIGVDQGEFACQFLEKWQSPGKLLLIDPYEPYENMNWDGREIDLALAVAEISRRGFAWRVKFLRETSPEIAERLPAEWHLQFIYIDACHVYEACRADIHAWYKRLDPGGILAGHDFADHAGGDVDLDTLEKANGVVRAVMEFAQRHRLPVHIIKEPGTPASWYLFKPQ